MGRENKANAHSIALSAIIDGIYNGNRYENSEVSGIMKPIIERLGIDKYTLATLIAKRARGLNEQSIIDNPDGDNTYIPDAVAEVERKEVTFVRRRRKSVS